MPRCSVGSPASAVCVGLRIGVGVRKRVGVGIGIGINPRDRRHGIVGRGGFKLRVWCGRLRVDRHNERSTPRDATPPHPKGDRNPLCPRPLTASNRPRVGLQLTHSTSCELNAAPVRRRRRSPLGAATGRVAHAADLMPSIGPGAVAAAPLVLQRYELVVEKVVDLDGVTAVAGDDIAGLARTHPSLCATSLKVSTPYGSVLTSHRTNPLISPGQAVPSGEA